MLGNAVKLMVKSMRSAKGCLPDSDTEDFNCDLYTPSLNDFDSKGEPIMLAIDKKDISEVNAILLEPARYKAEYIIEYIEFSITKMLLDVSKDLLTIMFSLSDNMPDNIYDLSMICEYCLATIDYNALESNDKDQWQDLLITHIISPADAVQDCKNKFSLSVSAMCAEICQSLRTNGRSDIVDRFTSFAAKYQPLTDKFLAKPSI